MWQEVRRIDGWVFLHMPPRQSPALSSNTGRNSIFPLHLWLLTVASLKRLRVIFQAPCMSNFYSHIEHFAAVKLNLRLKWISPCCINSITHCTAQIMLLLTASPEGKVDFIEPMYGPL